jgi:hypothetical protein
MWSEVKSYFIVKCDAVKWSDNVCFAVPCVYFSFIVMYVDSLFCMFAFYFVCSLLLCCVFCFIVFCVVFLFCVPVH